MIEVYEEMAQQMDAENYTEYLRLICELEDKKDRRIDLQVEAIRHLGDSIKELASQVATTKPPTVINLLITDSSDPKVKDFIDKISMLKEQGKL